MRWNHWNAPISFTWWPNSGDHWGWRWSDRWLYVYLGCLQVKIKLYSWEKYRKIKGER